MQIMKKTSKKHEEKTDKPQQGQKKLSMHQCFWQKKKNGHVNQDATAFKYKTPPVPLCRHPEPDDSRWSP